jgi:hypothetical protein
LVIEDLILRDPSNLGLASHPRNQTEKVMVKGRKGIQSNSYMGKVRGMKPSSPVFGDIDQNSEIIQEWGQEACIIKQGSDWPSDHNFSSGHSLTGVKQTATAWGWGGISI